MTTAYTSLLGLALPVTGELSGTWGDTVNNSITSLLDSAIAGTQTLTTDTTLSTTTGSANTSRQAILLCSPASANITITAPAQSKIYTVINTSATYTVTVRGAGPTTGVTLGVSEKAVVAWNGSDFVKVSNTTGDGTFANLTVTGNTSLGDADTDTITQAASYVTGTQLKSAKTATNTLSLAAYDVDGTAYTDLITLTASNTPTLALTSTGVGTINNMSIGATTASTGAFTTLSSTGNTTLGDASTDTVTVNGYMGIGGAGTSLYGLNIVSSALTGSSQYGLVSNPTLTSAATVNAIAIATLPATAVSAATHTLVVGLRAFDASKGAGSTITNLHGIQVADQTQGTNNYGISSLVSSGTNKYNIYASGTAANYFAGNVGIGTTAPSTLLTVSGTGASGLLTINRTNGSGFFSLNSANGVAGAQISSTAAQGLQFFTNMNTSAVLAASIDSSGNVGIGTSSPVGRLTIKGASGASALQQLSFEYPSSTSKFLALGLEDGTGNAQIMAGIGAALKFYTNSDLGSTNERMTITSAGNMGLGVTPSAWSIKALQVLSTSLSSDSNDAYLTANGFFDGSWKYINTDFATQYYQVSGTHVWRYAASGTAGNTISFTTAMTITSAGNVGIGAVNNAYNLVTENDNTTTGASQYSIAATATLSGTTFSAALLSQLRIAASTTALSAAGLRIVNPSLASGAAITDCYGIYIGDITSGTNDYGIRSLVSSGTNKYNLYIDGTADNYFAGDVGIGTASPAAPLDVNGSIVTRASGGEGGQVSFNNPDNASVGLTVDVSSADTARIFQTRNNSVMQIGQLSGTGGIVTLHTAAAERMRIDSSGNLQVQNGAVMPYAPAPASISTTATLTNANIQAQIINTTGTTYTVTMPLGTTLETLASWATTGIGYDFYIVNTASGTITLDATEVGVTSVGTMTIATGVSAQFRIRRTAANTFVVYRLG